MSEINLPPFYIGQKVVCVKTSANKLGMSVIKGEVYVIKALIKCNCGLWKCDVGVRHSIQGNSYCGYCGYTFAQIGGVGWCNCNLFAPIESQFQSISLSEILEKETELISSN